MATFNYHVLLQRFAEERRWDPEKVRQFDLFCKKQKIVHGEHVDNGDVIIAVKAFEKARAPSHAPH